MLKLATKCAPDTAALEMAYQAGFRQVELFLDAALLTHATDRLAEARAYPFEYVLHFPNRLDYDATLLDAVVHLYRGLKCACMVIHQPMIDKLGDALRERETSLVLAVENHKLSPEAFERWATQNVALTLDVEHLWMFTLRGAALETLLAAVRDFLGRHGAKLRHVHLPGYWPGHDEHRPMYCSRELVFPVLSLLAEFNFPGLIVSEIRTEDQTPFDLRMDVLLFDRWRETQAARNP